MTKQFISKLYETNDELSAGELMQDININIKN
jgi:hypothetical protein